jgi:hypothetical protein
MAVERGIDLVTVNIHIVLSLQCSLSFPLFSPASVVIAVISCNDHEMVFELDEVKWTCISSSSQMIWVACQSILMVAVKSLAFITHGQVLGQDYYTKRLD